MNLVPHFRSLVALALLLACCQLAQAVAPASIAGYLLYESSANSAHFSGTTARILKSDGTYEGVFSIGYYYLWPVPRLADARDGKWTYVRIDDARAELVIRTNDSEERLFLTFTSDREERSGTRE